MRKFIIAILIVTNILILGGCVQIPNFFKVSDSNVNKIGLKYQKNLIKSINESDEELLKSLFSEDKLSGIDDINAGIEYIFSLFDEELTNIKYDKSISSGKTFGSVGYINTIDIYFDVFHKGEHYMIHIDACSYDMDNPKNEGIYKIAVLPVKDDESEEKFYSACRIWRNGIYHPGWDVDLENEQ